MQSPLVHVTVNNNAYVLMAFLKKNIVSLFCVSEQILEFIKKDDLSLSQKDEMVDEEDMYKAVVSKILEWEDLDGNGKVDIQEFFLSTIPKDLLELYKIPEDIYTPSYPHFEL